MSTEIEVTVRAMTPRPGKEPLYTAEKFIVDGELGDPEFQTTLVRNYHALVTRAANSVFAMIIEKHEKSAEAAREQDAHEHDVNFKL